MAAASYSYWRVREMVREGGLEVTHGQMANVGLPNSLCGYYGRRRIYGPGHHEAPPIHLAEVPDAIPFHG